ncbi:hypothetical protein F7725_007943 [Dissostichus mawsoni]|uniref:Vasohibin 1 n=1 Tax=Dissostichus mawsoni TaxID=36200 RepID=A0A7J5Y5V4_DISMA|nr:hypothetical protein F7725_007943 [Dissostichus mawsoni]
MEASVPELSWVPAAGGGGGRGGGRMLRATAGSVEQRDEEQEDEAEEELRDGGVPFYVNRGGLPVDEETWERMWRHVARIHPNGEALGKETRGPLTCPRLMDIAKEMTREALPIKCLEAVILGIYLTNNMPGVERFPLSFQSHFSGNHFHHIVLGVHCGGRFGALGTSRREDLMFKPLEFRTLMDLVQEFEGAYRGYWHTLRKVRIGQYVSHDAHSIGKPAPPSPTKDRRNSMGSPLRGQGSPVRRISRIERRPSGDKKVLEPKTAAEINGYQIRV